MERVPSSWRVTRRRLAAECESLGRGPERSSTCAEDVTRAEDVELEADDMFRK